MWLCGLCPMSNIRTPLRHDSRHLCRDSIVFSIYIYIYIYMSVSHQHTINTRFPAHAFFDFSAYRKHLEFTVANPYECPRSFELNQYSVITYVLYPAFPSGFNLERSIICSGCLASQWLLSTKSSRCCESLRDFNDAAKNRE